MKNRRFLLYSTLIAIPVASLLAEMLMHDLWPNWRWENEPFHSTVVALGAVVAIFMALILIQRERDNGDGKLFFLAMGFLGMGLLEGFHAVNSSGDGFVFLHSVADLAGGFCFALVWLPDFGRRLSEKAWIPWAVAGGSILCGIWTLLLPGTLPVMIHNGEFTPTAIAINIFAGALFLAAVLRFVLDFYHSGSLKAYLFACMALLFGLSGLTFQYSSIWDNGWWLWHLLRLIAYLLVLGFLIRQYLQIVTDLKIIIADHKRTEEALRESEQKYRDIFNNAQVGIFRTRISDGKVLECNDSFARTHGYETRQECEDDFVASEHYTDPGAREKIMASLMEKGAVNDLEVSISRKDGDDIWFRFSARVYPEEGYLEGVGYDITEEKRALEALRKSEEKYRSILENIEDGFYETDLAGNFMFFNDSLCRIFGSSKDELRGVNYRKNTDQESAGRLYQAFNKVYMTEEPIKGLRYVILRKDGSKVFVELSASLIKNSDGRRIGFRGITRDVTERKVVEEERIKLEDQLHRAQKMESLGLMAGGIAHDLNNILSGIVSYPELLLLDIPVDSPLRKPIETIKESGMRAADVVADLLTIARGVATGKEALNLNTIVTEYLGSAEHLKLERTHSFIDFKTELDPELLNMSGSSTHIKKILMNLVTNASEAIEGSGTVTLSTRNRYLDEPLKGYEDVHIGEYAVLIVSDNGSGISSQDLERIFEPFYTKKVMGRTGTGLGLAVVWNSMQDHDGYINVSTSEKGTVFELYFPVTRQEVAAQEAEVPFQDYVGHGEKILVVDDEERQREIASGMLTKLGYNAETVASGEEAIEYVKDNPVDLIVLDMVMPKGINGRETFEEIIKIRPSQKAIIASGYAKTKEVGTAQELGAGKYVKKPYVLEKIGVAVKQELEK